MSVDVPTVAAADRETFALIRSKLHTAVLGDVLDLLGQTNQFLPPSIRAISPEMSVVGRAMPVVVADTSGGRMKPFGLLTDALDQLAAGEVYLAQTGLAACAAWGEILTSTARSRGAVGAVIDGYHRDTTQVLAQQWPVFSRGAYAQDGAVRASVVDYRVTVRIGSATVSPGDLVVGDVDGVIVVPAALEAEVLERALGKVAAEAQVLSAIEGGMSSRDALATFGVL